jgi:hypothetical protein
MLVFAGAVLFQSAGARTMQKILGAS